MTCLRTLVLTLVLLTPFALHAAEPCSQLSPEDYQTYVQLTDAGKRFAVEKNYAEAINAYQLARKLCDEDAVVTYNQARLTELSGDCLGAIMLYERGLEQLAAASSEAIDAATFDEKLSNARKNCVGTLELACTKELRVVVDGELAACPGELALPAGTHHVKTFDGVELSSEQSFVIEPEKRLRLELDAAPIVDVPPEMELDEPSPALAIAGWSSAGLGLALLATGTALHFVAEADRDEFRDASRLNGVVQDLSQARAAELEAQANDTDTIAAICLGVGGAALAVGVTLLVLDWSSDERAPSTLSLGLSPASVSLSLHF
ncbi:MAG: hypothetical protein RBU37_13530 [Myxococcota bacterium]|nr:hypothetical protein [Myxococcota bacterium]